VASMPGGLRVQFKFKRWPGFKRNKLPNHRNLRRLDIAVSGGRLIKSNHRQIRNSLCGRPAQPRQDRLEHIQALDDDNHSCWLAMPVDVNGVIAIIPATLE
jgi:hypothetical protein